MENKLEKIKTLSISDFNAAIDQFALFAANKEDKILAQKIEEISKNHKNAENHKKEIALMGEKLNEFKRSFEDAQKFVKTDFNRLIDESKRENSKILFFASNPIDTPILKLEEEFKFIGENIRHELSGVYQFKMIFKDVKIDNFFSSILQNNPRYIHF